MNRRDRQLHGGLSLAPFLYPITISIQSIIELPEFIVVLVRLIYALFLLFLIISKKEINNSFKSISNLFTVLFFVFYTMVFFKNNFFDDVVFEQNLFRAIGLYMSILVLLLAIFSIRIKKEIIVDKMLVWSKITVILISLLIIKEGVEIDLSNRFFFEKLNSTSISAIGASLIVLVHAAKKYTLSSLIFIFPGFILIFMGGSRGVLLSLILYFILIYYKKIWLLFPALIILLSFLYSKFSEKLLIINRIYRDDNIVTDIGRLDLINDALEQFYKNPIFGGNYLELKSMYYPHNLPLEVMISTGLVGFTIFLVSVLPIKGRFGIIGLFFLAKTFFSGGIFMSVDLIMFYLFNKKER